MLADQIRIAVENLHALAWRHARPDAGAERLAGGFYGGIDIAGIAARDLANDGVVDRVDRFEGAPLLGLDELAIDEISGLRLQLAGDLVPALAIQGLGLLQVHGFLLDFR